MEKNHAKLLLQGPQKRPKAIVECATDNTGWYMTEIWWTNADMKNYFSENKKCDLPHIAQGGWTPMVVLEYSNTKNHTKTCICLTRFISSPGYFRYPIKSPIKALPLIAGVLN